MTIISKSGLYSLILTSRKPEAKAFKRWVTGTVLPSIRKHGGYVAGQEGVGVCFQLAADAGACFVAPPAAGGPGQPSDR